MDYKFITTFKSDFTIADRFGNNAIKDTFKRAFKEWKNDYKYLTELVLVLNWKIWEHYEKDNEKARIYNDLWLYANNYAVNNLKDDKLKYFYETVD